MTTGERQMADGATREKEEARLFRRRLAYDMHARVRAHLSQFRVVYFGVLQYSYRRGMHI